MLCTGTSGPRGSHTPTGSGTWQISAFVDVPWEGLVSEGYTELRRGSRSLQIGLASVESRRPVGVPGRPSRGGTRSQRAGLDSGTTHLCAMDGDGNAVSLTNTIMAGFGSGIVPKGTGVVMNNGMMWFDPIPGRVNSIMPGKYPLNNMTPGACAGFRRPQAGRGRFRRAQDNELCDAANHEGRRLRHGTSGSDRLAPCRLLHAVHQRRSAHSGLTCSTGSGRAAIVSTSSATTMCREGSPALRARWRSCATSTAVSGRGWTRFTLRTRRGSSFVGGTCFTFGALADLVQQ